MKKAIIMIFLVLFVFAGIIYAASSASATLTDTGKHVSSYGDTVLQKTVVTVAVTKDPNDANDVNASVTSGTAYRGELKRVKTTIDGNDPNFGITIRELGGSVLFTKTDCNYLDTPLSYALSMADKDSNSFGGIFVDDYLIFDVNQLDPNIVTSATVTLYWLDERNR